MKSTDITEAWSEKYKRSINCNNPKGFSQRAHCAGRKKTDEDIAGVPVPKHYNPDGDTYRNSTGGGRIPNSKSISKRDITVKGQRAELPNDSYEPDMLAGVNKQQLKQLITAALDTLSKREAMILRARFGIEPFTQDHTLEQVGNAMGISKDRVRQLEARALRKLKHPSRSRTLRGMLDDDISNLPDWETIVAIAVAANMTPMAIKAMWSTAKGAYKIKKFADKMGIKLADKLVGEAEEELAPLAIDYELMKRKLSELESKGNITPEEADTMRRAIQNLATGRKTIHPEAVLQLITVLLQ